MRDRELARRRGVVWVRSTWARCSLRSRHLRLLAEPVWMLSVAPGGITAHDLESSIAKDERVVEARTLGPLWQPLTDCRAELPAATTCRGGGDHATGAQVSVVLGRQVNGWSTARMQLIYASDVCAPARGHLAFTGASFASFIVSEYEARHSEARLELTSLSPVWRRIPRT